MPDNARHLPSGRGQAPQRPAGRGQSPQRAPMRPGLQAGGEQMGPPLQQRAYGMVRDPWVRQPQFAEQHTPRRRPSRPRRPQGARARSASVTFAEDEDENPAGGQAAAPLNILPALPAHAVYHYRFPPLPGEAATENDRKQYIARRRSEMKVLAATIRMKDSAGDLSEDEREWYAVLLTAIHLCRPWEQQKERQRAALQRSQSKLDSQVKALRDKEEELDQLRSQLELSEQWVSRHQQALTEIEAMEPTAQEPQVEPQAMDAEEPEHWDSDAPFEEGAPSAAERPPRARGTRAPQEQAPPQIAPAQLGDLATIQASLVSLSTNLRLYQERVDSNVENLGRQFNTLNAKHEALLAAACSPPQGVIPPPQFLVPAAAPAVAVAAAPRGPGGVPSGGGRQRAGSASRSPARGAAPSSPTGEAKEAASAEAELLG